jgi:phosphoglycolate phosphatase
VIGLVAFDLDGTLVDSHRDIADATNAVIADLGGHPLEMSVITSLVGDGAAVLIRRAMAISGLDVDLREALERFLNHYDARLLATTAPYPGMVETLRSLHDGRTLAVLTNKPQQPSLRLLDGLGLSEFFSEVVGGDTPHGRKPDPAGLRAIMANAGVAPAETILVGDSPVDLQTARLAGTRICLARYGFGYRFEESEFDGTELFVDEPAALVAAMAGIEAQIPPLR